jgi:transglutaminase-like putative cysteine protease
VPAPRSRSALAAVSAVTAFGYSRVFSDGGWMIPVALAVIGAHGVEAVTRRWSWPQAALAHAGALFMLVVWVAGGEGFPTPDTPTRLGEAVARSVDALRSSVVPAPSTPELLLWAVAGMWGCAAVADGLAHRRRAGLLAVVPLVLVYAVVAALGTDRFRLATSFAFVAAVCLFVAIERVEALPAGRARTGRPWAPASRPAVAGAVSALVVATIAVATAPVVPGGASAPIIDLRALGEGFDLSRVAVNPLVDVKPYLSSPPVTELFTVRSAVPAYWRLTALERFDGRLWSPLPVTRKASLELEEEAPAVPPVAQEFHLEALDSAWLPAAYRAVRLEARGGKLERGSVVTRRGSRAVKRYRVESSIGRYGPAELAGVEANLDTRLDRQRELPPTFPVSVRNLAREIVGYSRTPYGQARVLQDYFRSGLFTYSTSAPAGHSGAHLEHFLFRSRTGYCEQFAAAFAAMARSLGMPARVAVGFTPGTYDPGAGVWRVTTKEAHAWPEVYFTGFGWAAFEPTPERYEPSPGNHTGTYRAPVVAAPGQSTPASAPLPTPAAAAVRSPRGGSEGDQGPLSRGGSGGGVSLRGMAFVLVPWLLLFVPPLLKARRRRGRQAGRAGERVAAAWWEALDRLAEAGLRPRAPETPLEFARRAAAVRPAAGPSLRRLAVLMSRSAYGARVPEEADGSNAWAATAQLSRALGAGESRWTRWRHSVDPRPLLARGAPGTS